MLTVLICISNSSSTFSVPATPAEKPSAVAAAAPTDTVINVEQLQLTQQQQLLPTMQELLHGMQEDRKARTKIHFHQVT